MRKVALVASLLLTMQADVVYAQGKQLSLRWGELAPVVSGRRIAIAPAPGARVEGRVLEVRIDTLELDVLKTSDEGAHPKGRALIPRSSVSRVEVIKERVLGRVIGAAVGAALGTLIFALSTIIANETVGNGATGAEALWIVGGGGAGYLWGWATDRGKTTILIRPEPDR